MDPLYITDLNCGENDLKIMAFQDQHILSASNLNFVGSDLTQRATDLQNLLYKCVE